MKQVITPEDWWNSVYEYMIETLNGRFRIQFPKYRDAIDDLIRNMDDKNVRSSYNNMVMHLNTTTSMFGAALTVCTLTGCDHKDNHAFLREYINLVWDLKDDTERWLLRQGIVVGQSWN